MGASVPEGTGANPLDGGVFGVVIFTPFSAIKNVGGLSIERYAVPKDRSVPVMDNFPLAILEDPSGQPVTTSEVIEFAGGKNHNNIIAK